MTKDGEYLGTWGSDDTDATYEFTPDGETVPALQDVFMGRFCIAIEEWRVRRE
ncbi:hypothetical protein V6617_10015 [Pelagibacterium nitratireducens]|uniref:Uncharacterized protein n=1 Tax=Pelagibacterium nitratireducens TaxID=1046114 RepID=A0ABZ2I025_9HYPH